MTIIIEKVHFVSEMYCVPIEGTEKTFTTKEAAWDFLKSKCDAFASPQLSIERFKDRTFALKSWGVFRANVRGSKGGYRWRVAD